MVWSRVRAGDKLAFSQDLQADPMLTDLQKRLIAVIATHWDNSSMAAECSRSFLAAGAGTVVDVVKRYTKTIVASGRVSIKRPATRTSATIWDVNWWFRGSAWVRANNGGSPIPDIREVGTVGAHNGGDQGCADVGTEIACGLGTGDAHGVGTKRSPNSLSIDRYIGAPIGARPDEGAQVAPVMKEKKENPHRAIPGFAKWRIVHAEYSGDDEAVFTAHLRSGKARKFVLRCPVRSEEYGSLEEALGLDGDATAAIGKMIQMSTARSGLKEFKRAGPLPWVDVEILAAEDTGSGASVAIRFDDDGSDGHLDLGADDATRLAEACGGEDEAVGAQVRYRLLPDETMEFRRRWVA